MTRRILTLVAMIVTVLAMAALPGIAQEYPEYPEYPEGPGTDPGITCTPETAGPGDEIECTAGPFVDGTEVEVEATLGSDTVHSETATADGEGFVEVTFDVPDDAVDGDVIDVSATGEVDALGTEETVETSVEVETALPKTGGGLAVAGLATLLMGAWGLYRFGGRGIIPGA